MVWASPTRRREGSSSPARNSPNLDSSEKALRLAQMLHCPAARVAKIALPARTHALRRAEARECGEAAQHIG
jgi:hypothetical protein